MSNEQDNLQDTHIQSMTVSRTTTSRRRCMICCGVATLVIVLLLVAFIAIFFTVLKPKEPAILVRNVVLEGIDLQRFPFELNVTLGLVITIKNRNYGSFKYTKGAASISYYGEEVAVARIEDGEIPARASHDVRSFVNILADKLVFNGKFYRDIFATGWLNFTSTSVIRGKATLFFLKTKATVISECSIGVSLNKTFDSVCDSKVKI